MTCTGAARVTQPAITSRPENPRRGWDDRRRARSVRAPPLVDGTGERGDPARRAELTAPTLVVVGELEIGWLHTVARQLEAALPDVRRVEEPGVGHMMMLEAPARTAELVRAQLGRVEDATMTAQVLGPPAT